MTGHVPEVKKKRGRKRSTPKTAFNSKQLRKRPSSSEYLVEIGKRPRWAFRLDDREYLFVMAYARLLNAAAAAREIGYNKSTAATYGSVLMSRPHVREAIHEMHQHRLPLIKTSMMERLMAIVSADISDYVDWNDGQVTVKSRAEIHPDKRLAIKSIKERRGPWGSTVELMLHNPIDAIEKLANLMDLMPKAEDAKGPGSGPVTVIIEGLHPQNSTSVTIDHDALKRSIAENAEADPEELPPGA